MDDKHKIIGKHIQIGGVPITVASDEECEKADFVVCVLKGQEEERFKKDNIYTTCHICGREITHRPYVPKTPPKVCIPCAMKAMEASQEAS
jgi:hypothetical protein